MAASRAAIIFLLIISSPIAPARAGPRPPVIDMHLHASTIRLDRPVAACPGDQPITYHARDPRDGTRNFAPDCPRPIWSAPTTAELRERTIAEMRKHNVRRAVIAGKPELVAEWAAGSSGRLIPASLPVDLGPQAAADLRALHSKGRAAVFGEVGAQYLGLRADDPKLEPMWALAEELDVPVMIHLGEGMPGQSDDGGRRYRAALTSPFQLEEVLLRHPRLRVYVAHAASPLTDEMIAMLYEYPQLYVDVGANVWNMPRAQFHDQLRRLVEAGFSKRILFGSDQTIWPQAIGIAIESIERAPFLTALQKRDILYHNAARFLRLTPQQIALDHR